jgi:hypothetical protein
MWLGVGRVDGHCFVRSGILEYLFSGAWGFLLWFFCLFLFAVFLALVVLIGLHFVLTKPGLAPAGDLLFLLRQNK